MNCEICGRKEVVYKAKIEGTELQVCEECRKFGKIISKIKIEGKPMPKKPALQEEKESADEIMVENYGEIIKNTREKLGLSQEDFAKKINEKISVVHKLETRAFVPSIELARKIGRFLKIKLVLGYEESENVNKVKSDDTITIGDVVKVKK